MITKRWTNVDPDVSRLLASEWRKGIRVAEIAIAASKDICQPESKATVTIYEEYW